MMVLFGSARINENGKATGGKPGDQTGREVSTQSYYMSRKGWIALRQDDPVIAVKLAEAMLEACNNNCIGYNQNKRSGVITQLKTFGSLRRIGVNTDSDCSSLVRACVIQATGKDPGNFTTANEKLKLMAAGFHEVPIKSASDCRTGDILVTKTKGHTVIVVSGELPEESAGSDKYRVICTAINVRVKPNDGKIIRVLRTNAVVTVYEQKNGWGKISQDKQEWISLNSKYMKAV
jgi:hypothetical protein